MFVVPSMILLPGTGGSKSTLLHGLHSYAILTRNVEITTIRDVPEAALAGDRTCVRSRTRARDSGACPSRGPTGLCFAGSHDCADAGRNLDRSAAASGLDTNENATQPADVWSGLDADCVFTPANGKEIASHLLRRECFSALATVDHSLVRTQGVEPKVEESCAFDRCSHRFARRRPCCPVATAESV